MQKHTHWWIDRKGAFEASKEIVGTNLHLEGAKLDSFLKEHFDDQWKNADVLETGWVEIERMAMFYKKLMDDPTISIQ